MRQNWEVLYAKQIAAACNGFKPIHFKYGSCSTVSTGESNAPEHSTYCLDAYNRAPARWSGLQVAWCRSSVSVQKCRI